MQNPDRFKQIFELSPEAIIIVDKKGDVIELNNRLSEWLGYDVDSIKGDNISELPFLSDENKKMIFGNLEKRLKGDELPPYDVEFISKTGEIKIGRIRALSISDDKGGLIEVLAMISDVTKENESAVKLERSMMYHELLSEIAIELNKGEDFDDELNSALKMLGEKISVDRVYIFEDSDDDLSASNTYEWTKEGISSQKSQLQDISYSSIPSWKEIFKTEGLIKASDVSVLPEDIASILEPQDIKSILVLPLMHKGEQFGFLGFDQVSRINNWEDAEVELIRTASGVISAAYQRNDAQKQIEQKVDELERLNKLMTGRELKMRELKTELQKVSEG